MHEFFIIIYTWGIRTPGDLAGGRAWDRLLAGHKAPAQRTVPGWELLLCAPVQHGGDGAPAREPARLLWVTLWKGLASSLSDPRLLSWQKPPPAVGGKLSALGWEGWLVWVLSSVCSDTQLIKHKCLHLLLSRETLLACVPWPLGTFLLFQLPPEPRKGKSRSPSVRWEAARPQLCLSMACSCLNIFLHERHATVDLAWQGDHYQQGLGSVANSSKVKSVWNSWLALHCQQAALEDCKESLREGNGLT